MINLFRFSLGLGLLFGVFTATSQDLAPCATPNHFSSWLLRYQANPAGFPKSDETIYAPVQIHIVGDDEGNGYYGVPALLNAFCQLNKDFEQVNVQFYLANDINYINESDYYQHEFDGGAELIENNNYPDAVNCYFVQRAAGACGYFFPGVDGIVLAKGCVGPGDHTWAHEMGHFLSLPHTFSGWEGYEHDYSQPAPVEIDGREVELLDGSNCQQAGDRFCDTQADYLNYRWSCSADTLSGVVQHDPDSNAFRSIGRWFMSYSLDQCMGFFSNEQIAAMRSNLLDERITLPSFDLPGEVVIPDTPLLVAINPIEGSLLTGNNSVTLQWEPVPNATHYLVQWNPFPFFNVVLNQAIVEGNSITITDLEANEGYSWRFRPFNAYQTCTNYSNKATFNTGALVAATDIDTERYLRVYPNPTQSGQFTLELDCPEACVGQWTLSDALGRVVNSGIETWSSGRQSKQISVATLPEGIYFLRLQLNGRDLARKLVVQN